MPQRANFASYAVRAMLYLTQFVYVHPGKEAQFEEFESIACAALHKYRGQLLLRLRPDARSVVSAEAEVPYELHVLCFASRDDFARYAADPERQQILHLKAEAVRASLLIEGTRVA